MFLLTTLVAHSTDPFPGMQSHAITLTLGLAIRLFFTQSSSGRF
jgi:hypothetical protein